MAHPAAAPISPWWPATCPAAPPTIAPLMQPFALAGSVTITMASASELVEVRDTRHQNANENSTGKLNGRVRVPQGSNPGSSGTSVRHAFRSGKRRLLVPDGARIAVCVIVNVETWEPMQPMPRTVLTPPAGVCRGAGRKFTHSISRRPDFLLGFRSVSKKSPRRPKAPLGLKTNRSENRSYFLDLGCSSPLGAKMAEEIADRYAVYSMPLH
jgi:hypothetical protein